MSNEPKKYVSLHNHSGYSIGDGMSPPEEHIKFCMKNGLDAHAFTDHGNMNHVAPAYLYGKEQKKKGENFKIIHGNEFYFIPSIEGWRKSYQENIESKRIEAELKKTKKKEKKNKEESSSDEFAPVLEEIKNLSLETTAASSSVVEAEDNDASNIVENEEETKDVKTIANKMIRNSHLVMVAKSSQGLKNLFSLTSRSYIDGFYYKPRIDFDLIRKYAKNEIVCTTACLGSYLFKIIIDNQVSLVPEEWEINSGPIYDRTISQLETESWKFVEALGGNIENFYLELQFNKFHHQNVLNKYLIDLSKKTGIKCVVNGDAHYANPTHWKEREIYKLLARQSAKSTISLDMIPETIDQLKCELYPKNASQIWDSYKKYALEPFPGIYKQNEQFIKEAVERGYDIAHSLIGNVEPDTKIRFPSIEKVLMTDEGKTLLKEELSKVNNDISRIDEDELAYEDLKFLSYQGLKERGLEGKEEYTKRLEYELDVIKTLKISKYFIVYSKFMKAIKEQIICGSARGSGGASLVCYLTYITEMDPIKYNLLFERFLNKYKAGFPDIDSDLSDRDKALEIIKTLFGVENVIAVTNFNGLKIPSLLKDLGKLYGIPYEEINLYTSKIEDETVHGAQEAFGPGFDRQVYVLTLEEAEKHSQSYKEILERFPVLRDPMRVLFKQIKSLSRHAGGLVISEDTTNNLPVVKSGKVFQTPWSEGLNFRHLEPLGFLKYDVLGLETLRMIESCIRNILKKEKGISVNNIPFSDVKKWYEDNLHPDKNMMDDIKVYKHVYWEGRFPGIFQFVEHGVQEFIKNMKPKSIVDLAVGTSLYRPGPLGIKADKTYLSNRNNPEAARKNLFDEKMFEVLEDTGCLPVFQEQIQLLVHKLSGVPLDKTDGVRKAFMKKDISNVEKTKKDREALKVQFIKDCKSVNNIPEETSEKIFDMLLSFVSYSFNKSHAVAYSINSYMCAWLFTYYPAEWLCACLDVAMDNPDKKEKTLKDIRTLGWSTQNCDINYSDIGWAVNYNKKNKLGNPYLVSSFKSIKNVGDAAVEEILKNRPYNNLEDLLWTTDGVWKHSRFNKRVLSALIQIDSFQSMELVGPGCLFENTRQMHETIIPNIDVLKRETQKKKVENRKHEQLLQKFISDNREVQPYSDRELFVICETLLGVTDYGLLISEELLSNFKKSNIVSIEALPITPKETGTFKFNTKKPYRLCWFFVVSKPAVKQSSSGKDYLEFKATGVTGKVFTVRLWGFNAEKMDELPMKGVVSTCELKKDEFGCSGMANSHQIVYLLEDDKVNESEHNNDSEEQL